MSGFLSKLFGEFRPGNTGATDSVGQQPPTNPGQVDKNTTVPNANTLVPDGKNPAFPQVKDSESPLANHKDLWQLPDGKSTQQTPTSLVPNFEIDRSKIREAASKVDFTVGMDAALLDKASKGDPQALAQIINSTAQNAYAAGAESTLSVTKNALTEQDRLFKQMIPEILRRHTSGNMLGDNPAFSNPALQPIVTAVQTAISSRLPNASSAEVAAQTKEVMNAMALEIVQGMGGTVNLNSKDIASGGGTSVIRNSEMNWESWFDADTTKAA